MKIRYGIDFSYWRNQEVIFETHADHVAVAWLNLYPTTGTLTHPDERRRKSKCVVLRLRFKSEQHLVERNSLGAIHLYWAIMLVGDFRRVAARKKQSS
jgi:hypothetical protein